MLTDLELGWIVGLLEGEGSFYCQRMKQSVIRRTVSIATTDLDVLLKYKLIVEKVTNHTHNIRIDKKKVHKDQYRITIVNQHAIRLMKLILTHMGERRKLKIEQCLIGYLPEKRKAN